MSKEKKEFPLEDVLSSIYGVLLCNIGNVYKCLGWLFNDYPIYTHQIPKAGRQAQPLVEAQHPFLKEINLEGINPENWTTRLAEIKSKYPKTVLLERIGEYNGSVFSDLSEIMQGNP